MLKNLSKLQKKPKETVLAHKAFLLWAMQNPLGPARGSGTGRSGRLAARASNCSEASIRKWRRTFKWAVRVLDPAAERVAASLYAALYHDPQEVEIALENMRIQYVPPGESGAVDETLSERERLQKLYNDTEAKYRASMLSGETVPKLSDLATLQRMMDSHGAPGETTGAGPVGGQVARSERVEQVRKASPGDALALLQALQGDWQDMGVILDVLREQAASEVERGADNVIPMAGGAK